MQTLTILIKPASSSCNLDCSYCFYHDVANHRSIPSHGIMQEGVQTALIEKAFDSGARLISFAFQGGEPTLAGLDFYRRFVEQVHVYNTKRAAVSYSIQTNGYVLDEEWVKFFKENDFLVGVSVDGPSHIHDAQRKTNHQKPTHLRIMESISLLQNYDVPFNILCVLSNYVAEHIEEVYEFFMSEGFRYIQFIPCLNQMDETNAADPYALSIEKYRDTLNVLFDLYKDNFDHGHYIGDRLFDNYVRMGKGFAPESCSMAGSCTTYFVIEANGDVYPCDFYALDAYKMGNITQSGYDEMFHGSVATAFRTESVLLSDKCKSCKHLALCRGGCKRYKVQNKKTNEFELYYCHAYYDFFERNTAGILEMGRKVLQGHLVGV